MIDSRIKSISFEIYKEKQSLNIKKVMILIVLTLLLSLLYLTVNVDMNFLRFVMSLRVPKLAVMIIAALCIGAASLVFQTIINNRIVTPCLLGMNSLYLVIHTAVYFFLGAGSIFVINSYASYLIDMVFMSIIATIFYGYLFKKTRYNVLYVLLAGTVMSTFFGSLQNSMIRVMDPNDYDQLLATLVADMGNVEVGLILISLALIGIIAFVLKDELKVLDVVSLGKHQSVNLGVDYDKVVRKLLLGVTVFIAVATALVGPISFLGLIIANLSRQLFKTYKHNYLILGSVFIGTGVLIGGQLLVEHVFSYAIPVSVFITIGGGLYFLYLLLTSRGKGYA